MRSGQHCLLLVFLDTNTPRPREGKLVQHRCSSKMRLSWKEASDRNLTFFPLCWPLRFHFFLNCPFFVSDDFAVGAYLFSCLNSKPQMNSISLFTSGLSELLCYLIYFSSENCRPAICMQELACLALRASPMSLFSALHLVVCKSTRVGAFIPWKSVNLAKLKIKGVCVCLGGEKNIKSVKTGGLW